MLQNMVHVYYIFVLLIPSLWAIDYQVQSYINFDRQYAQYKYNYSMDLLMRALAPEPIEPTRRRRQIANTTISTTFKKSMGAFISFFQQTLKVELKPTLKENEQAIADHFKKINNIIDKVDEHLLLRMSEYQSQIFGIVKGQIESMQSQNQKLVQILNKRIQQKNSEDEMFNIFNQLDYFKSQALKLFNQCKKLRGQVKMLQNSIKEYDFQLDNNHQVLQKMKKRDLRQKILSNNMKMAEAKNKTLLDSFGIEKKRPRGTKEKRIKTQMEQIVQKGKIFQNESIIDIQIDDNKPNVREKSDKNSSEINFDQILDVADFSLRQSKDNQNFAALNMKKIQSQTFFKDISLRGTKIALKKDQGTQTEIEASFSNLKINSLISKDSHLKRRTFLQKEGFNMNQTNRKPHGFQIDFLQSKDKNEKQKTRSIKLISQSFVKNKLKFNPAKDRYKTQQKSSHYE